MKIVCLIVLCILLFAVLLLLIALVRTLLTRSKTSGYTMPAADARAARYAKLLSEMVQCDTTSHDGIAEPEKFAAFHRVLESLFPAVHDKLEKTVIDGNLLFYWKGKSSDRPLVLMSHQDVVPAEGEWKYPPFSGEIADGKSQVLILKAARFLQC